MANSRPTYRITRPEDRFPPVDSAARKKANKSLLDLSFKVDQSISITAGTGLVGGGDLSADRELAIDISAESDRVYAIMKAGIVAGTGITIVADDVAKTITISLT